MAYWADVLEGTAAIGFDGGTMALESVVHRASESAAGLAVWPPVAECHGDIIDTGLRHLVKYAAAEGKPVDR